MVTLPFLALAFLLIVAFSLGIAVGAILKDPAAEVEKREPLSTKPRANIETIIAGRSNALKLLSDNKVFLDISNRKSSLDKQIRFIRPPDVPFKELVNKKPLDRIGWKHPIDIKVDLIDMPDILKKKPRDKKDE